MAGATTGTIWLLLNYVGQLFTADPTRTPLLSMIGGLTGGGQTNNFEFSTSAEYDLPSASQPEITEDEEASAKTPTDVVTTQVKNVCQTHWEAIRVSYTALANQGRISGISTVGKAPVVVSALDFQIARKLEKIARDVEYSFIQGSYQISTDSDVANKTRGLNECASDASNTVAAGGADLSKDLVNQLLRTMYGNGAIFGLPVFIVNAFQKEQLSTLYGYAPQDRNVGGVNINQIETDYGKFGVVLDPFQSTSVLLAADLSVCSPVFNTVPKKGNLFYEPLAKTVAAESGQLYGKIGLYHGPKWYHGTITGLATS